MLRPRQQSGECRPTLRNIMDRISLNECHVFTRHEGKNECTDLSSKQGCFLTPRPITSVLSENGIMR